MSYYVNKIGGESIEFATYEAAEQWIEDQRTLDPVGVERGYYDIDQSMSKAAREFSECVLSENFEKLRKWAWKTNGSTVLKTVIEALCSPGASIDQASLGYIGDELYGIWE